MTDDPTPSAPPVLTYVTPDPPASPWRNALGAAALACALLPLVIIPLSFKTIIHFDTAAAGLVFLPPQAAAALAVIAKRARTRSDRQPRSRRVLTGSIALWLGCLQLVAFASGWMILTRLSRARDDPPPYRLICQSHLRMIGLAIQLYANDNADRLPPDLATVLATNELTSDVFLCPATSLTRATGPTTQALLQDFAKPGHCSYIFASPLPAKMTDLSGAHVLAYEPMTDHDGNGMNVLYGDGHAEWISKVQADYIVSELNAGHNPPRKKR